AHDTGDAVGREAMAAAGNEIAEIGTAETARIAALGDEVISDWVVQMTAKGLDGQMLIDDARAAVQLTVEAAAPGN
ncbi:MAG: C4-dicarboxylate ABC transporter, partial [Pseudomonadota bacterium]